SQTDAADHTTTFGFDPHALSGTATEAGVGATSLAFDSLGNVTRTVDPLGQTTEATYSGDRVVTRTLLVGQARLTTTFGYAGDADVTSVAAPLGPVARYTYGPFGQVRTASDPLSNTQTIGYDGAGNPVAITDATGQTVAIGHDSRGSVTSVEDPQD